MPAQRTPFLAFDLGGTFRLTRGRGCFAAPGGRWCCARPEGGCCLRARSCAAEWMAPARCAPGFHGAAQQRRVLTKRRNSAALVGFSFFGGRWGRGGSCRDLPPAPPPIACLETYTPLTGGRGARGGRPAARRERSDRSARPGSQGFWFCLRTRSVRRVLPASWCSRSGLFQDDGPLVRFVEICDGFGVQTADTA